MAMRTSCAASARLVAIGFSTSKGLPDPQSACTTSQCVWLGELTMMASMAESRQFSFRTLRAALAPAFGALPRGLVEKPQVVLAHDARLSRGSSAPADTLGRSHQTIRLPSANRPSSGQNAPLSPSTSPTGENSRYKASTQDSKVTAQGMAKRQGVRSTSSLRWKVQFSCRGQYFPITSMIATSITNRIAYKCRKWMPVRSPSTNWNRP